MSRRIALGFGVVLGLALILAVVGIVALRQVTHAYDTALQQERTTVQAAMGADVAVSDANEQFLRFLLSGDETFAQQLVAASDRARALLDSLRDDASIAGTRDAFDEALAAQQAWVQAATASSAALRGGDQADAFAIWEERALPAQQQLSAAIGRGVDAARVEGDTRTAAARGAAQRTALMLLVTAVIALVFGLLTAWLLNRAVAHPLRETTGVLASSAAEILAATTQQAASASETSAAVVQTSSTVNEVAQTAEHAADRARMVSDLARRAAEIGRSGRQAVEDSAGAMAGVKDQVERIAGSIVSLAEQAQAIGEIITTVNEIAEQTNLLALNAAVEAARSGEHGRGFAVVAGEIRTLADEARRSTTQVRKILGEIQRATNAAVMTTERGSQEVATASRQVTQAGETIRALAEAVGEASLAAAQIVASAGEQSVGMSQVRQAMGNIETATQQTVASTRQAEAAAQDLNRLGARLLDLVGRDGLQPRSAARA
ncbi:MAG TPA: methyl-accepting chemotaxis protein [Longimicrobiales bacterium]